MTNKICVITGGTDGIGKNLTFELIKNDYKVYVLSRYKNNDQLKKIFGNYLNKKIFFLPLNLDNFKEVKRTIFYIQHNLKNIDLFIWNAGIALNQIKNEKTNSPYNKIYQVNFISHAIITLSLVKYYPYARYIFISSILSNIPLMNFDMYELNSEKIFYKKNNSFYDYGLSKYYMNIFSKYLSSNYCVDSFSIEPGFIKETKMNTNRNKYVLKMNEIFISKVNSMEETINFIMRKALVKSKTEGELFKFNGDNITEYSKKNIEDLIDSLENICKQNNFECNLSHKIQNSLCKQKKKNFFFNNKNNENFHYKLINFIKQISMLYPIIVYIIILIYCYKGKINCFAILYIFVCDNLTKIIKKLIEKDRPKGCFDDGLIIKNKRCNSFGMPSLHSQNAILFSIIVYFTKGISNEIKIAFIIIGLMVSISRYLFNFHTLYQVIIGILFGVFYGVMYKNFNKRIINFIYNNANAVIISLIILISIFIYRFIDVYSYNNKCIQSKIPDLFIDKKHQHDIYDKFLKKIFKNSNYKKYYFNCFKSLSPNLSSEVITWEKIDYLLKNNNIPNKKYDYAIGIFSGGAFICKRLANILNIKNVSYLNSKLWTDQSLKGTLENIMDKNNESKILSTGLDEINIKNKNILLIDDSVYTGITIKTCKKFLLKRGAKSVDTYVLITKNKDLVDYYSVVKHKIPLYWPWGYELN